MPQTDEEVRRFGDVAFGPFVERFFVWGVRFEGGGDPAPHWLVSKLSRPLASGLEDPAGCRRCSGSRWRVGRVASESGANGPISAQVVDLLALATRGGPHWSRR